MNLQDEVIQLLYQVPKLCSGKLDIQPVSEAEIDAYEKKHKLRIPTEFRQWLMIANGALVEPGTGYGILSSDDCFDIAYGLKNNPSWRSKGWLPVATDGCGDYYVIDTMNVTGSTHPIYFIDQMDYEKADYVVASGLWKFLRFSFIDTILLYQDLETYWPCDKERVIAEDPDITLCKYVPTIWEADGDDDDDDDDDGGNGGDDGEKTPPQIYIESNADVFHKV